MKAFNRALICLSLAVMPSLALLLPAEAAIQRSADFTSGHNVGVGLFGLSYDYGMGPFSIGTSFSTNAMPTLVGIRLKPAVRSMWRFMEMEGLSAGVIAGLQLDPGDVGGKASLVPDLGVGMAYNFKLLDVAMALRLNLTLATANSNTLFIVPTNDNIDAPVPNALQRLTVGPQTSLELAFMPTKNLEITLGGGTWVGMRVKL